MANLGATVEMEGASGVSQTLYNPIHPDNGGTAIVCAGDGNFSSGATWVGGVAPGTNDNWQILSGQTVHMNAGAQRVFKHGVVEEGGKLIFDDGFDCKFWTIINAGWVQMGIPAEQGQSAVPIAGRLLVRNIAWNQSLDPYQFYNGILSINNSRFDACGTIRNVDHLIYDDLTAGATTVTLYKMRQDLLSIYMQPDGTVSLTSTGVDTAHIQVPTMPQDITDCDVPTLTGWKAGDTLVFIGSKNISRQDAISFAAYEGETRTIASISGNVVTLSSALSYNHISESWSSAVPKSGGGTVVPPIKNYLVIQNLSRDLYIESEGTDPSTDMRGHTLFTHKCRLHAEYFGSYDTGRSYPKTSVSSPHPGSVRGRYPGFHIHHIHPDSVITDVDGNDRNYIVKGCAVWHRVDPVEDLGGGHIGGPSWCHVAHDVHFGEISYCDAFNWFGAGCVVTEEGQETKNRIEYNRSVSGTGTGERLDSNGGDDGGEAGSAFWFAGFYNYVNYNIAANTLGLSPYQWGFMWYGQHMTSNPATTFTVPNRPGVDEDNTTPDNVDTYHCHARGFLEHRYCIVMHCGAPWTQWQMGSAFQTPVPLNTLEPSAPVVEYLTVMGTAIEGWGIFQYESVHLTMRGCVNTTLNRNPNGARNEAVVSTDYPQISPIWELCMFEGNVGVSVIAGMSFDNGSTMTFRNSVVTRFLAPSMSHNTGQPTNRKVLIDNVIVLDPGTATDHFIYASYLSGSTQSGDIATQSDYVEFRNFNGVTGDNFLGQRGTYTVSSVDYPPIPTLPNPISPRDGLFDGANPLNLFSITTKKFLVKKA